MLERVVYSVEKFFYKFFICQTEAKLTPMKRGRGSKERVYK